MKLTSLVLFGLSLSFIGCGPDSPSGKVGEKNNPMGVDVETEGLSDRIAVEVTILDEDEIMGKAEMYLKMTSSATPDLYWLLPLNVGVSTSGNHTRSATTPFSMRDDSSGKLTLEVLDDDDFSDAEEALLVKSSNLGAGILCDGVNLYATSQGLYLPIDSSQRRSLQEIAAGATKVIIENINQHKFDSLGSVDYIVRGTHSVLTTNPVTIVELGSNKARCNVRFYLLPSRNKK